MGVPMEPGAFVAAVQGLLGQVQEALLSEALAFRDAHIVDVGSYEELKAAVAEGAFVVCCAARVVCVVLRVVV
jgi:prolyl-tRNA synthetase